VDPKARYHQLDDGSNVGYCGFVEWLISYLDAH
jgi:hypothetical protein